MNEHGDIYLKTQWCGIEEIGMVSEVAPGVTFLYISHEELYEGICCNVVLKNVDSVKPKTLFYDTAFSHFQTWNNYLSQAQFDLIISYKFKMCGIDMQSLINIYKQ